MEIEGVVISILPPVKGTSARGEWTKQEIVLEQPGEFGRKVCVSFWGDRAQDAAGLKEGESVSVSVNVESREHNGRWYTEVRAWKMTRAGAQPAGGGGGGYAAQAPQSPAASGGGYKAPMPSQEPDSASQESFDDLPF